MMIGDKNYNKSELGSAAVVAMKCIKFKLSCMTLIEHLTTIGKLSLTRILICAGFAPHTGHRDACKKYHTAPQKGLLTYPEEPAASLHIDHSLGVLLLYTCLH
jgi:hypothetical protein